MKRFIERNEATSIFLTYRKNFSQAKLIEGKYLRNSSGAVPCSAVAVKYSECVRKVGRDGTEIKVLRADRKI